MKGFLIIIIYCCTTNIIHGQHPIKNHIQNNGTKISHISVLLHHDKELAVEQVATINGPLQLVDCVGKCFGFDSCESMNYIQDLNVMDNHTCILLKGNMYANNSLLNHTYSSDYKITHISIKNDGCDSGQCLNNATCLPDYKNNSFTCSCPIGFGSKYCENEILLPTPEWWFPFNNDTKNYGTSPLTCTIQLVHPIGRLVYLPDRVGRSLFCDGKCSTNTITDEKWMDLSKLTDGITISLWIKLRPGALIRQAGQYAKSTYIISMSHQGYVIRYENEKLRWLIGVSGPVRRLAISFPMSIRETWKWHHVALTYYMDHLTGYIDGAGKDHNFEQEHNKPAAGYVDLFHPDNPCSLFVDDFKVWYQYMNDYQINKVYKDSK